MLIILQSSIITITTNLPYTPPSLLLYNTDSSFSHTLAFLLSLHLYIQICIYICLSIYLYIKLPSFSHAHLHSICETHSSIHTLSTIPYATMHTSSNTHSTLYTKKAVWTIRTSTTHKTYSSHIQDLGMLDNVQNATDCYTRTYMIKLCLRWKHDANDDAALFSLKKFLHSILVCETELSNKTTRVHNAL